jgi:hypothetical protein
MTIEEFQRKVGKPNHQVYNICFSNETEERKVIDYDFDTNKYYWYSPIWKEKHTKKK